MKSGMDGYVRDMVLWLVGELSGHHSGLQEWISVA